MMDGILLWLVYSCEHLVKDYYTAVETLFSGWDKTTTTNHWVRRLLSKLFQPLNISISHFKMEVVRNAEGSLVETGPILKYGAGNRMACIKKAICCEVGRKKDALRRWWEGVPCSNPQGSDKQEVMSTGNRDSFEFYRLLWAPSGWWLTPQLKNKEIGGLTCSFNYLYPIFLNTRQRFCSF